MICVIFCWRRDAVHMQSWVGGINSAKMHYRPKVLQLQSIDFLMNEKEVVRVGSIS